MKEFSEDMVRAQLERIMASPEFVSGKKLGQFLSYVVVQTLNGQPDKLTQYAIAVEALGYGKAFDPTTIPNVRVLARRLRRALERYYRNHGTADPIRIEIPKGGYAPVFITNHDIHQDAESAFEPICSMPATIEPKVALPDGPSIAILQFEYLGNQSENAFLASGITEEIVIAMTRFPEFLVIGPLNRDIIHQMHLSTPDIGQKYNARFLLDGTIRFRGQSLRILAKLTDTLSGYQLWGQALDYDIETNSVDQLENEIVGRIVAEIADNFGVIPRTLAEEVLSHHDESLSDYEGVLRFHHYNRTLTEKSMTEAIEALEKVVQRAPKNDLAIALLADLVGVPYYTGYIDDMTSLERAEKLARKAIALNPNSQQAHYAMAQIHYQRFHRAPCLLEIEQVLKLNPNNANYLAISALFLMGLGQWERSLALMRKAMRLNPHHPGWYHVVPFFYHYYQGEYETALFDAKGFNTPDYFWDPLTRAAVLGQLDHQAEAKKAGGELLALVPDFERRGRSLIQRMVYADEQVDMLLEGLRKAGMEV
jgi:adenylate cyclase